MNKRHTLLLFFLLIIWPTFSFAQLASKKDSTKKVTYAAIPVVNYNTSMGVILGAMGSAYYKLNENDTISPSSTSMLFGMWTSNKSWLGLGVQKFYINEDKWRGTLVAGKGNFFFQFFQGLPGGMVGQYNDNRIWIDFDTEAKFGLIEVQRQVVKNLYLGIEGFFNSAETTYDLPIGEIKPTTSATMNSLGYTLQFDSRDDVNFPVSGYFVNFKNRFVREWIGASVDFDRYELSANYFWDIKENSHSVLVSRVYAKVASGDVPFEGQNFIGGDDLRGYSKGEFRGEQIYAIQAELRQKVYKKFGMVGFVGVGSAVNAFSEIPDNDILPSIGVGVRYLMIAKEKVNIGVDVGVGKNDWSLTFRIGEAFSR
jgi:hypothetical protein